MTYPLLAARAIIGAAALALSTLAALHVVRPDLNPSSTMISQYARGPHGWAMGLCFAAFAASSACLFALLVTHMPPLVGRIGLALLLAASVGSRWVGAVSGLAQPVRRGGLWCVVNGRRVAAGSLIQSGSMVAVRRRGRLK